VFPLRLQCYIYCNLNGNTTFFHELQLNDVIPTHHKLQLKLRTINPTHRSQPSPTRYKLQVINPTCHVQNHKWLCGCSPPSSLPLSRFPSHRPIPTPLSGLGHMRWLLEERKNALVIALVCPLSLMP